MISTLSPMRITTITTDHLRVPLPKRGKISLISAQPRTSGGPEFVDLILARIETDTGTTGLGFTYLLGPGSAVVRALLETELAPLMTGENPHDTDRLLGKAEAHFRAAGFAGLPARAYSAIDIALWDLKARSAGVPLYQLLGGARAATPYFISDGAGTTWDAGDVVKGVKPAIKQGAMGVRVEIGGGDVNADAEQVRELHDALGDEAWLGVSAGGRYDLNTALALAHFFDDQGIDWFEDPIPAADFSGYARIADRLEVLLAVGATFDRREDFYRVIRDGLARVVRPDPCRLGGITPVLKIAAAAEAYHVAVSPVRTPEIGVHLACALTAAPHADSVSWFHEVFNGGPKVENGKLVPPTEPGLGLTVNAEAVAKLRV
ncbi:mandelate racemase/muconate lactonizing enzyme family protein [Fimbriiglobus ruber]|nr:mandelate racemase/muconate lactonizing enzyme family protein [Fimbriiglobus ruber]